MLDHKKSKGIPENNNNNNNIYFCSIDLAKVFDFMDHNKLWKILKKMEYQTMLLVSWQICMQVKKQQ